MATKRTDFVHQETIKNFPKHLVCEKVEVSVRDGTQIPVIMLYDHRFYSDESQWIIMHRGSHANKEDLAFQPDRLSLTDRGIVLAFPMVRGTRFFDDNWLLSGCGDRKQQHIDDLLDTAIFIKEQGLTDKLAIIGEGASGGHAALTAVFHEPYLWHGCVTLNAVCDLQNHLDFDIYNSSAALSNQELLNF